MRLGEYVINPQVEMEIEDKWVNVYEMMQLSQLITEYGMDCNFFFPMFSFFAENIAKNPNNKITHEDYFRMIERKQRGR